MKKIILGLIATLSLSVFAGPAGDITKAFNASSTPAALVETGWALNDGGKGYKILQIVVDDTDRVAELHINKKGFVIASFDYEKTSSLNSSYDYLMSSDADGWAEMGTGDNGPMYHMMPWVGQLSFEGPKGEAMGNMGPFTSFLILIGTNINN